MNRHHFAPSRRSSSFVISCATWCLAACCGGAAFGAEDLDFSRDVLPILSDKCLRCHGPDAATRKGDLRLDRREDAVAMRSGAAAAVVPGRAADSELMRRITSSDVDLKMPPADSGKALTPREVEILRRWIDGGAAWAKHWAFVPPARPSLRDFVPDERAATPLDALVSRRLARESLKLSPIASRVTLARRLHLDLVGLPPSLDELDAFLSDDSPDADQRAIDRLLASPRLGERFAMWWLDLARYADTDGYQRDDTRANWPWRDWVVEAFNRDLSLDEFTRLQLAGDLSANASPEDQLATAFQRHHMTNGEGGRDPEESRVDYVLDRVNTLGAVWLGLTVGCCQCHDHKYDPLAQTDYYQLAALFNSIDEDGGAGSAAKPFQKYKSPRAGVSLAAAERLVARRRAELDQVRATALVGFDAWVAAARQQVLATPGYQAWSVVRASTLEATDGSRLTQEADRSVVASGPDPHQEDYRLTGRSGQKRIAGLKLEVFPSASHPNGGLSRGGDGNIVLTLLKLSVRERRGGTMRPVLLTDAVATFAADKAKEGKGYGPIRETLDDDPRTGWSLRGGDLTKPHVAVFALGEPLELTDDEDLYVELGQRSLDGHANIGRFRLSTTDQAGPAVRSVEPPPFEQLAALAGPTAEIPEALLARLREQLLAEHAAFGVATAALTRADGALGEAKSAAGELNVMVLRERPMPRATHVLVRGVWNKPGEAVQPGAPASLAAWPVDTPRDRAGLAKWLMQADNPLPARVFVNQLWQNLWGAGLVRTAEDFGLQGERPQHVEALDWLAVELRDGGWDLKRTLREIVASNTYRQTSQVTPELLAHDPENRWLARGARYRLPAWMIRDAALAVAGLLENSQGGPPTRPHQPPGVWEENFMGRFKYEPSEGSQQYRRTVYAFWRRSIAPTFLFDAAQRRTCEVKVVRTNTPLHALTLLNDRTMLEASRSLAERALAANAEPDERLAGLWRTVLARSPSTQELTVLRRQFAQAMQRFAAREPELRQLLAGSSDSAPPTDETVRRELAALTSVAGLVLNLDEAITRE